MFSERGASSKEERPRSSCSLGRSGLGNNQKVLYRGVWTAYLVVLLQEVLMRRDTCLDLNVGQKLTTIPSNG